MLISGFISPQALKESLLRWHMFCLNVEHLWNKIVVLQYALMVFISTPIVLPMHSCYLFTVSTSF